MWVRVCACEMFICMYVYVYTSIGVRKYVYVGMHVRVCVYVCPYIWVWMHVRACISTNIRTVCVYTNMSIRVCMRTYVCNADNQS